MQLLRLIRPRFCRVKEFLRTAPPVALYRHSNQRLFIFYQIYSECGSKFPLSTARVLARLVLSLAHGSRNQWQSRACLNIYVFLFLPFSVSTRKHLPKTVFALLGAEALHMPCTNFSGCKRWDLMIPSFRHEL